ncbi:MAG: DUF3710 domain-containing protein [Micropruina sp.]|uniref:DUF3710 domain-containing protein n=1 Tax=Micropruina sp. TaxID=2737536 RepID=UPI0039E4F2F3
MIFRRKAKAEPVAEPEENLLDPEVTDPEPVDGEADAADVDAADPVGTAEVTEVDDEAVVDEAADDQAEPDADDDELPAELADADESDEEDAADEDEVADDTDWRADGPFDHDEVDLSADEVDRLDLGSLILTPWEGMNLQLHVDEASQQVIAVLAVWEQTGLELALLAAPTSGGLADELLEDLTEEAQQAGGSATTAVGPFGPELRRVLPAEGPAGEQLFQVSRTWFAEGPRWLLRGTLLGEGGLTEDDEGASAPFVEFFRNVVVRRGDGPMVPGEVIMMAMPTVSQA